MLYNLTNSALNLDSRTKMSVAYAAQICSTNVQKAVALYESVENSKLPDSYHKMAEFCALVGNWFDLINIKHADQVGKFLPSGNMDLLDALQKLVTFEENQKNAGFQGMTKETLDGIKFTTIAATEVANHVKIKYGIEIPPWFLNQDALEKIFSEARQQRGSATTLNCQQFSQTLRIWIF